MSPNTPAPTNRPRLKPCPEAANWQLKLRPSRLAFLGWITIYGASGLLVLLLNSPFLWKLAAAALLAACAVSTGFTQRKYQGYSRIQCIKGKIELIKAASGEKQPAVLFGSQWVSQYLCVLQLKTASEGLLRLPVFYDSADQEDLRQLRVFIKSQWYYITAEAPKAFWPTARGLLSLIKAAVAAIKNPRG